MFNNYHSIPIKKNPSNNNYFNKYIRYKKKYLELKFNQLGNASLPASEEPTHDLQLYSDQFLGALITLKNDPEKNYLVTDRGECHRSDIGLNEILSVVGMQMNKKYTKYNKENIVETINKLPVNNHYILKIKSPNHCFFIENFYGYFRILSLFSSKHGFYEYMLNIIRVNNHYGNWFKLDDDTGRQFKRDLEILNKKIDLNKPGLTLKQYQQLNSTLINMWGVNILNSSPEQNFESTFTQSEINSGYLGGTGGSEIVYIFEIN